jgi:predicted nucleic-acid-binding protein
MIGFDTNVLVRIVANEPDDPQVEAAKDFFTRNCSAANPGFVSFVALAEIVWTMKSRYGYRREDIANLVGILMSTPELRLENLEIVARALTAFKDSSADFADALIGEINRAAGCSATATFDKRARKLAGFVRIR